MLNRKSKKRETQAHEKQLIYLKTELEKMSKRGCTCEPEVWMGGCRGECSAGFAACILAFVNKIGPDWIGDQLV